MNEPDARLTQHRSASKAQFLTKFNRYRRLFVSKWWVLFLLGLIGTGVAWAISHYQAPIFTSVGRMIVNAKLSLPEGAVYTEELSNFIGTQAALMQSGVVVNRAHTRVTAANPAMLPHPVKLKVTVIPKTTIFQLQATGTNAAYVQEFLQAAMEEYIALKKEMRTQTSDTTVAGLTEEVLRLEKELRKADAELVAFQSTNSVVLLQEQGNTAGSYLAQLNQRLAVLKSEYELLKTLTLDQNLERRSNPADALTLSVTPIDRNTVAMDSDYLKAKQQIILLKAEQEELSQFLRPKHPKIIALAEEIARRERLLDTFRKQSAEQLESRKNSIELQIANTEKEIKEWDARTLEVSRRSAEFQRLKANSQRNQTLYERLLGTLQTLDLNKEISPESVTIMEQASPAFRDNPDFAVMLLIGALAGIGVAVLLLLFVDRLDDRMSSASELQQVFDYDILGQVPKERPFGPRGGVSLLTANDERHSFVEAYRNLRSSLFFMGEGEERPRTILFTSSVPNEGKSLTSANLAITLANAGMRVLLVDADLRKGNLHTRFQVRGEPGLTEALSQGANWRETVLETKIPNLSLLPRGTLTHRSSEFFLNAVTRKFLDEAAAAYDAVVVDTAPVMAADDVTSLAPLVDGVVFVVRAEHTSARVARAAIEALAQRQANVLGLVFNSVRPSSVDYYYYYKYKDYYSSSPQKANDRKPGKAETGEKQTA